jgi:hypothetical protein
MSVLRVRAGDAEATSTADEIIQVSVELRAAIAELRDDIQILRRYTIADESGALPRSWRGAVTISFDDSALSGWVDHDLLTYVGILG